MSRRRRALHVKLVRIGNRKIVTKGLTTTVIFDVYHAAMRVSWLRFFILAAIVFVGLAALFALLYACVPGSVGGIPSDKPWYLFFFAIETLSTIGSGAMHVASDWGHVVASVQGFVGLTFSAVLTGAIFARFSRATARLLFSRHVVIGQFEGHRSLMLRVANARANNISDATAKLWLMATIITAEGVRFRRFYQLKLDRDENPQFMLSWSLFHRIDADSPLYGWDHKKMEEVEAGFVLSVSGSDEVVAQTLRARHNYNWTDVHFDHQFVDLLENNENDQIVLDYTRFHSIEPEIMMPDETLDEPVA